MATNIKKPLAKVNWLGPIQAVGLGLEHARPGAEHRGDDQRQQLDARRRDAHVGGEVLVLADAAQAVAEARAGDQVEGEEAERYRRRQHLRVERQPRPARPACPADPGDAALVDHHQGDHGAGEQRADGEVLPPGAGEDDADQQGDQHRQHDGEHGAQHRRDVAVEQAATRCTRRRRRTTPARGSGSRRGRARR